MIQRPYYLTRLERAVKRSPVTALIGPRQCGKTTLARQFIRNKAATYFNLESQADIRRLQNPELVLENLNGLVVLDEIQVCPELYRTLKKLSLRPANPCRYLIIGSAVPDIKQNVSARLAGSVEFVTLSGLDLFETGDNCLEQIWIRGGFPKSISAGTEKESMAWREKYIRMFLERDIPQMGITVPAGVMRRFWTMLAHSHGRKWNGSELARSMGLTDKTVRSYLNILSETGMIRQLQPWQENLTKRQVRAPKVFLRDSGLLHALLGISEFYALTAHPKLGASWEGFAQEQILRFFRPPEAYFWATYSGAELDLLFLHQGKRHGFEMRYNEAPRTRKSMHVAIEDLNLDHLWVVYPGRETYPLGPGISVLPLTALGRLGH